MAPIPGAELAKKLGLDRDSLIKKINSDEPGRLDKEFRDRCE